MLVLVIGIGISYWYQLLVLVIGIGYWYWVLVLGVLGIDYIDTNNYQIPALTTDTKTYSVDYKR